MISSIFGTKDGKLWLYHVGDGVFRPYTEEEMTAHWAEAREERDRIAARMLNAGFNTGYAMKEFPLYQCHKQVRAAQIKGVTEGPVAGLLTFTDPELMPETVTLEWIKRFEPTPGKWLVVYADGYQSISPDAAFQDGYKLVERS